MTNTKQHQNFNRPFFNVAAEWHILEEGPAQKRKEHLSTACGTEQMLKFSLSHASKIHRAVYLSVKRWWYFRKKLPVFSNVAHRTHAGTLLEIKLTSPQSKAIYYPMKHLEISFFIVTEQKNTNTCRFVKNRLCHRNFLFFLFLSKSFRRKIFLLAQ